MKTNILCFLALLLLIVTACRKDDPVGISEPQSEPVKKYLAKVLIPQTKSTPYEVVRCTWDSLHRLKTYRSTSPRVVQCAFQYDSIGRVARIDCDYDLSLSRYWHYYLCNWKNEKELNSMDLYWQISDSDTIPHRYESQSFYYDLLGRITNIRTFNYSSASSSDFRINWEDFNIKGAGRDSNFFLAGNRKFDNKHNPWGVFPDMLILVFPNNIPVLAYNPSKNNPIEGGGFFHPGYYNTQKYEYDYDKDGYPLRQYYLQEDGTKILMYIFEYTNE